jgi:ABC-2 type transport system ATP-binding protein
VSIIEIDSLTKRYDGVLAVDGLSLRVETGERFGLLGPNGAGKTTTLLTLATLVKPTSGAARVNGYDVVREAGRVRKSIGIVFQDPSSDDTLTGYENLKLHGMLYSMRPDLRERRIAEVLDLVDLQGRKGEIVKHYSGGMRRRLELARGLMHHPQVLFLDEPTLGLDPQAREHIWGYIERLSQEEKVTVVITTHYMEEADRLCHRLAIIDAGRIAALDAPAVLKKTVGGDVVTLRAPAPPAESLARLPFVKKVDVQRGLVSLTVLNAAENVPRILELIPDVASVEIRSPTLNDVFLHYTGRDMREAAPEGGWAERTMRYRAGR